MYIHYIFFKNQNRLPYCLQNFGSPQDFQSFVKKVGTKRFLKIWNATHHPISAKYWTQALFKSYNIK